MIVYLVDEMEYERGWGSRREDQYLFPTEELALEFCRKYDEKYNTASSAPDWYMRQEYQGRVNVNEEKFEKNRYKGTLVTMPPDWTFTG